MKKIFFVLFFSLTPLSCDADYKQPHAIYRAEFMPEKSNMAVQSIKQVAEKWDLRLYEKDREQMRFHTQGRDAFYSALYHEGDAVLVLTNSGFGDVIVLSAIDYKKMPVEDLEKLTLEMINLLENRLGISFKKDVSERIRIEESETRLEPA